jgi:hypothetical protein
MKKADFLKRAKREVTLLNKNKRDPRYLRTIGFLVGKGFLHANREFPKMPNMRINVEDAIWAGKNVEPRILEVLPAAVMRLGRHFNYDPEVHVDLRKIIEQLKQSVEGDFLGVPAEKIRPWLNIRLKDRRVKNLDQKKVIKTFRLSPDTISTIKSLKSAMKISEAELLERLFAGTLHLEQKHSSES